MGEKIVSCVKCKYYKDDYIDGGCWIPSDLITEPIARRINGKIVGCSDGKYRRRKED